jgi:hypothetical protein
MDARTMMGSADIVGWMHNGNLLCPLCSEEKNVDEIYPLFADVEVNQKEHCEGCNARLLMKVKDWECRSCGTLNDDDQLICDGCDYERNTRLWDID